MRDPPHTGTDDAQLTRSARDGDRDAFAELVRRHQAVAVRVAAQVGDVTMAEDVAQEAFVKAFVALPRFDPGRPFRPWLLAIVANEARTRLRARRRGLTLCDRLGSSLSRPDGDPVGDAAIGVLEGARVSAVLKRLPERDRDLLVLRFVVGLGERETAAALGCRTGTIKSRTSRALAKLRVLLTEASG